MVFFNASQIKVHGNGNTILVKDYAKLVKTKIAIYGNNNIIIIGEKCYVFEGEFHIEDSGSMIEIGDRTSICGRTHLACIEGCKIKIGNDCLLSSELR